MRSKLAFDEKSYPNFVALSHQKSGEASSLKRSKFLILLEAITTDKVALLRICDMLKAADRGMIISEIKLLEKSGGQSGLWQAG